MKKQPIVARAAIALNVRELEVFNQAVGVRYHMDIDMVSSRSRNHFLRLALWEYCSAIVRLGKEYEMDMLSCELRKETPDELADRIGEPRQQQLDLPDNVVDLFPAA